MIGYSNSGWRGTTRLVVQGITRQEEAGSTVKGSAEDVARVPNGINRDLFPRCLVMPM